MAGQKLTPEQSKQLRQLRINLRRLTFWHKAGKNNITETDIDRQKYIIELFQSGKDIHSAVALADIKYR